MKRLFRFAWPLLAFVPVLSAAADAPPGRYTIGSGTVYDNVTKLTWQQAADSATYTLPQAGSHCSSLGGGWRMPKVSELLSIVDRMKTPGPAIDLTAFPNTGSELFWSSTALTTGYGWGVDFTDGTTSLMDPTFMHRVRCVR